MTKLYLPHVLSRRTLVAGAMLAALPGAIRAALVPSISLRTSGGRAVSVSVWRASVPRRGTILFSHGAMSAPWKYQALLGPWAEAGYDIFAPLHVDSTDHPDTTKYPGYASWRARMEDMHLLSDHLGRSRYIAAGHSFGGLVALTLGGAAAIRPDGYGGPMRDTRAHASAAFSPPGPLPKLIDDTGYATLAVPAFIQTGTRDAPLVGGGDWRTHLAAYEAPASGGHRYGLVLDGVDHFFGNIICRPELIEAPQADAFERAVALTLLFMHAYGDGDPRARTALDRHLSNQGPTRLLSR